ncbi:sodium/hydrogen exchanger 7-like [Ixodes scapularis]|nr:sodium/hydrogen exchanger 7-like [Ixodes scapularis]
MSCTYLQTVNLLIFTVSSDLIRLLLNVTGSNINIACLRLHRKDDTAVVDYLTVILVIVVAVSLKKVQRSVHLPYTVFMFIAGLSISYRDTGSKGHGSLSVWLRGTKFHVLMTFVPAATVYATLGINHFIFRRCHKEIVVFSVGTLGISTLVCALYAFIFMGTNTLKNSLIFGILLCSNERFPMADKLFEEGRYPILTTMLQAESALNNIFVWSVLGYVDDRLSGRSDIWTLLKHLVLKHAVGLVFGVAMGTLAIRSLRLAPQSQSSNTILLVVLTYVTFCTLEWSGSSGVDGVVAFTLMTNSNRLVACTELEGLLQKYWSAIYDVSGFMSLFMTSLYTGELLFIFFQKEELKYAIWSYCMRTLVRFFAVAALFPIIEQFGYPVSWRQAVVTVWMGLKGPLNITVVTYYYHRQATTNVDFVAKTFLNMVCDTFLTQLINLTFLESVFRIFGGVFPITSSVNDISQHPAVKDGEVHIASTRADRCQNAPSTEVITSSLKGG